MTTPFAERVAEGMRRRGMTLRALCRDVRLDPSFFSKVLSGKRSPPASEPTLRRLARLLGIGEAELIVAAGRIPSEWKALWRDEALFEDVHQRMVKTQPGSAASHQLPTTSQLLRRQDLSEELL